MSQTELGGHRGFVGWWETVHHTIDGEPSYVDDVIEQIRPDGSFEVFLDGDKIGGGRHVDFIDDPPGYTNIQSVTNSFAEEGPQLVIYKLTDDLLEFCKAPQLIGRPTGFTSPVGSGWIHGAIRRISENDPRIPHRSTP